MDIKIMNLDWAKEFADKLTTLGEHAASVIKVINSALTAAEFVGFLRTRDPECKTQILIHAGIEMGETDEEGKPQMKVLQLASVVNAGCLNQILNAFLVDHCETIQRVKEGTPELQNLLGSTANFPNVMQINPDGSLSPKEEPEPN